MPVLAASPNSFAHARHSELTGHEAHTFFAILPLSGSPRSGNHNDVDQLRHAARRLHAGLIGVMSWIA